MDRGLTIKQVADLLGVRPASVYRLVYSGVLTGRRIGKGTGTIRVLESDLRAYLDSVVIRPLLLDVAKQPAPVRYPKGTKFTYFPLDA